MNLSLQSQPPINDLSLAIVRSCMMRSFYSLFHESDSITAEICQGGAP